MNTNVDCVEELNFNFDWSNGFSMVYIFLSNYEKIDSNECGCADKFESYSDLNSVP